MLKLQTLADTGQAIWFDYIRRSLITSGEMQSLIDQGVRGVTSNPTIFEKAIAGSADYDEDIKSLSKKGTPIGGIYEHLALSDIARTADLFRSVYDKTGGLDGYVSIEVSPTLAHDAGKTIDEARRLFSALHRPNIMIKVPATPEGIIATEALISEGINVNVTLLFGVKRYEEAACAYLSGLERLAASGRDLSRAASVASFFVSRVDSSVDPKLEKQGLSELAGKIAIANAKVAYGLFREIFSGPRWQGLEAKGARPQRLLWASTGTKNPKYPDTLYIDELIGPHTVNTVPPATLQAYLDHGKTDSTLKNGIPEARERIDRIARAGIDLDAITQRLQDDGVELFAGSFKSLMDSIAAKRREILAGSDLTDARLADLQGPVDARLELMRKDGIMGRIHARDHTVWKSDPHEITNRLGWLSIAYKMLESADNIEQFARDIRAEGFTHAYLLGMGGSSLAPEVMAAAFGVRQGFPGLTVIDTTDPDTLASVSSGLDYAKSLFIVSTKSGSTVETLSAFNHFYTLAARALGRERAGRHFIAITDPGSALNGTAERYGFRNIFLSDPDIGGRYSALSHFGLVPAALIGVDIRTLLDRALVMSENCEPGNCPATGNNHGGRLGAILGEAALHGRDKVTFVMSEGIEVFGDWVEQLVAESTGKEGKGIVPVVHERLGIPDRYGSDRLFVHLCLNDDATYDRKLKDLEDAGHPVVRIRLHDVEDMGAQFILWETAVAIAGSVLGINPFDQPDVEAAKKSARHAVEEFRNTGVLPVVAPVVSDQGIGVAADLKAGSLKEALASFLEGVGAGSYVAVQAYVAPGPETDAALEGLRMKIRDTLRTATMCGYGPRYLHSTGQLHKGDAGKGLFIQIISDNVEDLPVPDEACSEQSSITFGILKKAQALGDFHALKERNRPVICLHIQGGDVPSAIGRITRALG